MHKRKGGFLKGILFGALAGATAGVLFAPKSGKETREDLAVKAKELSTQANKFYSNAKAALEVKLKELKKVGETIDKSQYTSLVDEVVKEVKKDGEVTKDAAKKLGTQLKEDWKKVSGALKA